MVGVFSGTMLLSAARGDASFAVAQQVVGYQLLALLAGVVLTVVGT